MAPDHDRSRSASPPRDSRPRKQQKTTGFKWKEKRPQEGEGDSRDSNNLERGYRNRSPRRDNHGDERRGRDEFQRGAGSGERDGDRRRDDRGGDNYRPGENRDGDGGQRRERDEPRDQQVKEKKERKEKKEKKEKKPKPPVSNEPMIVVNVNDRLGTKAAIPCLASDSVKAFKAMVAAHIGRQPHEIMLKRQGERPFKDQLSLEDYGVSHGVQLDLELDTGD